MCESTQPELDRLIEALCQGSISVEEAARLNDLLARDTAARSSYLERLWMDAELFATFLVSEAGMPIEAETVNPNRRPVESIATSDANLVKSRAARFLSSYGAWLAVAAALLIACLGSGWLAFLAARGHGPLAFLRGEWTAQSAVPNEPAGEMVAQITGTRDCRWADGQSGFDFGSPLHVGETLNLQNGLVELTFRNRARMVLEGPATFTVPGGNEATLVTGRMSATVPRAAVGFTVSTHRVAINDPGAQFGLVAYANGDSEVHVFGGPVRARAIDTRGQEVDSIRLASSEAARLTTSAASFSRFSADGDHFVRTLERLVGPSEGLLAIDEFDYPAGPLAWHNGGFGWAGPWTDLDSRSGPDDSSTNAVAESSLAGAELLSQGNRAIQTGNFNRIRRQLSTSMRGVFDIAGLMEDQDGLHLIGRHGKVVYLSFMQRVSQVNDVYYGFELHRGDGNANRVLSIGHGAEGTGYGVASNFNTIWRKLGATPLFAPLGEEDTIAHLMVVRIEFGGGDRDVATIYRDPASLLDEERCTPTATLNGNLAFDRISLASFDSLRGQVHEVDEIRVGTSFTAVTGQRSRKGLPLTNALTSKTALLQRTTILLPSITPSRDGNDEQSPQATGSQPDVFISREARWQRSASGHVWLSTARGRARRYCGLFTVSFDVSFLRRWI
jgi:hypothetical protein